MEIIVEGEGGEEVNRIQLGAFETQTHAVTRPFTSPLSGKITTTFPSSMTRKMTYATISYSPGRTRG